LPVTWLLRRKINYISFETKRQRQDHCLLEDQQQDNKKLSYRRDSVDDVDYLNSVKSHLPTKRNKYHSHSPSITPNFYNTNARLSAAVTPGPNVARALHLVTRHGSTLRQGLGHCPPNLGLTRLRLPPLNYFGYKLIQQLRNIPTL